MIPKLLIRSYTRVTEPIRKAVTKFGGQPVWLEEPTWPISAGWNNPMRFVCQILLEPAVFGEGPRRMAYVFLTQAERDAIEDGQFDPDIIFPDEGENCVVLQPGEPPTVETKPLEIGPSLYCNDGSSCELSCNLEASEDYEYIPRDELAKLARQDRGRFDAYCKTLYGDKIGGTPSFGNNDSWPENGQWDLLLQLLPKRRPSDPFYLNLGATLATGFAFISADRKKGCFLVD